MLKNSYSLSMRIKMKKKDLIIGGLILFAFFSCLLITPQYYKTQSIYRSSQLQTISFIDGNTERVDFITENGEIVVAADKGYATCTIISEGDKKLYTFFDNKGEQISRFPGYYALLREYDNNGNNISISYLDMEGNLSITAYGYAIEKRKYNENRQIVLVEYLDADSNPICTAAFANGKYNEYDSYGNNYKSTFINESGKPMMTDQGYASVLRVFYLSDSLVKNKVESEYYFDDNGDPVALSLGQYGVHKEYNENGLESVLTYLNSEGYPIVNTKGYTTVKKTYHADDSVATEQYFDAEGQPVSLSEGQFGIRKEKNQIVYLDKNGEEIFNLKRLLYNHTWIAIYGAIILMYLSSMINRKWNCVLLFFYMMIIAYMTLLFRNGDINMNIDCFWQYTYFFTNSEARTEILRNIWLFIPLGAILWQLYPKKKALLMPIAFSIVIEIIQYVTNTGFCDLGDVVSNGFGSTIGFTAEGLWSLIRKRKDFKG